MYAIVACMCLHRVLGGIPFEFGTVGVFSLVGGGDKVA